MLLDTQIEPRCSYCRFSRALGRDEYACIKQGIMHGFGSCSSYRYEPTKRLPPSSVRIDGDKYTKDDFSLTQR